jgi:hypothetical protein
MGIIEEIEKWLEGRGQWWSPDGKNLLIRAVARLRALEEAFSQSGYPKWPAEPEAERPAEPTIESYLGLAERIEALKASVEALEAREEARGRARAAEEATMGQPAPPADMASKCASCGCFIRVEGARCGVCRGEAPNFTAVIQPLRQVSSEPKPGARRFPVGPRR